MAQDGDGFELGEPYIVFSLTGILRHHRPQDTSIKTVAIGLVTKERSSSDAYVSAVGQAQSPAKQLPPETALRLVVHHTQYARRAAARRLQAWVLCLVNGESLFGLGA